MILDNLLLFTGTSNGATATPAVSANTDRPTTGTQSSSNIIDLHIVAPPGVPVLGSNVGARDMGIGDDPALKILAIVTISLTGGTNLTLSLQGSPDNGSGAPAGFVTWWTSPTYVTASNQLVGGSRLFDMDMPRPPQGVQEPRFLQFQYVSTGTFAAGSLEIAIVLDRHDQFYQGSSNAVLGGYTPGVTIPN